MRIKKGSRVEVWRVQEGPMGAWRSARVLWGNGHAYIVRYDYIPPDAESLDGRRIPRKSVRPCPPEEPAPEEWGAGDMAEVFDDYAWKCAEVVGAAEEPGFFDANIVGSSTVVTVSADMLRVRRILSDEDEWVVIHKEKPGSSLQAARPFVDTGKHGRGDGGRVGEDESRSSASESAKRSRSHAMVHAKAGQRPRFGGKKLRTVEELRPAECAVAGTEDDDDDDDDTETDSTRVDSNSSRSTSSPRAPQDPNAIQLLNSGSHSDERTESCSRVKESLLGTDSLSRVRESLVDETVGMEEQIHDLELNAYNSTVSAFYASGPLSWKQEELLTNLRLVLHISGDEHLQVIKGLISRSAKGVL